MIGHRVPRRSGWAGCSRKSLAPADGEGDEFSEVEPTQTPSTGADTHPVAKPNPDVRSDTLRSNSHQSRQPIFWAGTPAIASSKSRQPILRATSRRILRARRAAPIYEPDEPPADLDEPDEPPADLDEPDEPPADLHEPAAAPVDVATPAMRRTPRPRFTCRSPTPTWPPPGTRSRPTPSQAGTGLRRAISTSTFPRTSTSSTRNSPAPTGL